MMAGSSLATTLEGRADDPAPHMTETERAYAPAARRALAAFGFALAELRFVHLSENVTFKVTDARDGSPLVLRLHRPWFFHLPNAACCSIRGTCCMAR